MNKRQIQRRLNLFYEEQYQQNYGRLSFFGNLFRYWFGWYQEPHITALQTYLKAMSDTAAVPHDRLSSILADRTTTVSERTELTDPTHSFTKLLLSSAAEGIVIDREADLRQFPAPSANATTPDTQITLGDLHGNAIKLIYCLVREGVLQGLTEENYARLIEIYNKPVEAITAEDLASFNRILDELRAQPIGRVRLIGDVLCDRGMNDYYTLRVLATLKRLNVPVEIEASNHDIEFLSAYNKDAETADTLLAEVSFARPTEGRSMTNLQALLRRFPGELAQVKRDIETTYLPSVTVLNYSLSPDQKQITLYTHAPVNLETIEQLARYFSVEYKAGSARELAGTIDRINAAVKERGGIVAAYQFAREEANLQRKFRQCQVRFERAQMQLNSTYANFLRKIETSYPAIFAQMRQKNLLYNYLELYKRLQALDKTTPGLLTTLQPSIRAYNEALPIVTAAQEAFTEAEELLHAASTVEANPLHQIIWHRPDENFTLPIKVGSDEIHFVYGHVGSPEATQYANGTNLDTYFGKGGITPIEGVNFSKVYTIYRGAGRSPSLIANPEPAATPPRGGSPLPLVDPPTRAASPAHAVQLETYYKVHAYARPHPPTDLAADATSIRGRGDEAADTDSAEGHKLSES